MGDLVRVPHRFRGFDDLALGGYVCGSVARRVPAPAEVSLLSPPPLERDLEIVAGAGGTVELRDGDVLVAEGATTELRVDPPSRIGVDDAAAAAERFPYRDRHPRPSCVVCGPGRADGLRIFPGPIGDGALVAAVWTPDESLPAADGAITPEVVWSTLDCPTYFGGAPAGDVDSVLARLGAHLVAPVRVGQRYAIGSWPITVDGRKRLAGVAMWSEDGEVCALGHGLWVEPRAPVVG